MARLSKTERAARLLTRRRNAALEALVEYVKATVPAAKIKALANASDEELGERFHGLATDLMAERDAGAALIRAGVRYVAAISGNRMAVLARNLRGDRW